MTRLPLLAALAASLLAPGCTTWVVETPGPRATAVEEIVVEPGTATGLSVETSAGDVEVGPPLAVRGAMTVRATISARSEEDLARVHPFARVEGDTLRVGYTVDAGTEGAGVSFALEPVSLQRTRLKSSAGNLRAVGIRGDLDLETSAGDVAVEGADGCVVARTSAGNISVAGRLRGACLLESSAGNVEAAVSPSNRLKVTGRTSAGNARSELSVGTSSSYASARLDGVLGDGSEGTLEMRTAAGNLALRRLP